MGSGWSYTDWLGVCVRATSDSQAFRAIFGFSHLSFFTSIWFPSSPLLSFSSCHFLIFLLSYPISLRSGSASLVCATFTSNLETKLKRFCMVCVCDIIRCVCVLARWIFHSALLDGWVIEVDEVACQLACFHTCMHTHTHTHRLLFFFFFPLIPGHMIPFMVFWVKEKYLSSICNHHLSVSLLLNKCLLLLYGLCRLKTTFKNIFLQFYVLKWSEFYSVT